eukprot:5988183-Karenia_brevis.AAC.1
MASSKSMNTRDSGYNRARNTSRGLRNPDTIILRKYQRKLRKFLARKHYSHSNKLWAMAHHIARKNTEGKDLTEDAETHRNDTKLPTSS